jgi:hypothetical protein
MIPRQFINENACWPCARQTKTRSTRPDAGLAAIALCENAWAVIIEIDNDADERVIHVKCRLVALIWGPDTSCAPRFNPAFDF